MNIEGLDYNTQRSKIRLTEYGREIQQMVDYCVSLPTKEERLACAKSIISVMKRMTSTSMNSADRLQTLWSHLAIMSDFKLDIDYPVEITTKEQKSSKPEPVAYPEKGIKVRHYGQLLFKVFEQLKTMPEGAERNALVKMTANQMKRSLLLWGHGNSDNEKVASDLELYTDGKIRLDLSKFKFEKIDVQNINMASQPHQGQKKKKKK